MPTVPPNDARLAALAAAAKAWQDPDFAPRAEAAAATLGAPNRFTEEALAFAINQQMHQLGSPTKLRRWLGARAGPARPIPVGVVPSFTVPLDGLRALAAVWLAGHAPVVRLAAASPYLLPAFAETVAEQFGAATEGPVAAFVEDDDALLARAEALIGAGEEDLERWRLRAADVGLAETGCCWLPRRRTVAVVDGTEDFDVRIRLAEDVLLHEGLGEANVVLLWAPANLDPDPYFEAFSGFRQVMPAHRNTEGVLEMPRAFLKAAGQPYAWGDGVLVSRGEPEVQMAGHLRWVEYDRPEAVVAWIEAHRGTLRGVVATKPVAERLGIPEALRIAPGDTHRSSLGSDADARLMDFLRGLDAG